MKRGCLPCLAFVVVSFINLLPSTSPPPRAEAIILQPQATVLAGANPLDPSDYVIPCVTDWNGDGKKDLLVGYRYAVRIAFYRNSGTDVQPAFTNFVNVQAGGTDSYVAGTGCGAPAPWVCDYDGDGKRDLLVGDGYYGYVYSYRNTNTDSLPSLAPGVALKVGTTTLSVGARANPYVHDWDEDGLPDLLCGDANDYVNFFRNIGTRQAPGYAVGIQLHAGGTAVNFGIRAAIRVLDWDGDGRKDLVGSGISYAGWCRNVGSDSAPTLEAKQGLSAPVSGHGLVAVNTSARVRLDVVDWNSDGTPDLLIGNTNGRIYLYTGYRFVLSWLRGP